MAIDEGLAERIRDVFAERDGVVEKKMFGGLCFMVNGHMCCGITNKHELMVRVGPASYEDALSRDHARKMDFTGRPMKGFIMVDDEGYGDEQALAEWIDMGVAFVTSLPPK